MTRNLIALDWGTSSLRAFLLGPDGALREQRAESWGIMRLPEGGFVSAFAAITRGWTEAPHHALACGMVGSAQGWTEVPYVPCPAGAAQVAHAMGVVEAGPETRLHVVPGVAQETPLPNVMRGEETQILGALAGGCGDGLYVLPGTHSKWVTVADGQIRHFDTVMTGEIFGLLRAHSILGRPAREAGMEDGPLHREAFIRGVATARGAHHGVGPLLFTTRSLVLMRQLRAEESLDYLSGLLIGEELRSGLASAGHEMRARPAVLIGDPALVSRYELVFELFGCAPPHLVRDAALDGLRLIARRAGWLAATTTQGTCP